MYFMRKLAVGFMASLLATLLFLTAVSFGTMHTIDNPANVKRIIKDSGLYNNVISGALDQAQQNATSAGVSLADPAVKAAAAGAFSPQLLQKDTEQIIDSVYAWLDGKSQSPDFKIDLSGAKTSFADGVAQAAQTRAASLPRCTTAPASLNVDAFNATCLPPGITPAQVAADAKSSVLGGNDFLSDPVLSAGSLKKSGSGQSVFDTTYKKAPARYQQAKKTPYFLAVLAILDAAGIVLLSASRLKGLRKVGVITLVSGLVLLAFVWGFNWAVTQKLLPNLKFSNTVIQADARALVQDLVKGVNGNFRNFGIAYAALGVLGVAGSLFFARRAAPQGAAEAAVPESQTSPPAKPKSTKKTDS